MVIQFFRVRTPLSEDEVMAIAQERAHEFRKVPGLIQKYYVKLEPDQYGGIYVWDSRESLAAYRDSELRASIQAAYKALEPPRVEVFDMLFQLRE